MRCVGAVIVQDGALLLVRRGRPPGEGLWSIPGGRVEPGETDHAAVIRELAEETALTVEPGALLGSVRIGPYDVFDYRARVLSGEARAGDDAADLRWVPLTRLGDLPLTDGLRDALLLWRVIDG
ncbi:ADP-ribose pyrophosphatase YjhB (NUDIX family) [Actinocorallia herbida]|uniref:ADP-ribose pyrophosphatase YjhB (NUDIX family) n=1 Tax=Actinocorallia herbida TaxID=58109 RepID=A0A3N1CP46_9ACTN|nr:NUDIX domain-containing protein [Actinocorallia herbida]ROO83097.1 ADP-ribose pyrophosphatase YjhB (NUDIX family) [Actinocorallia herbida]